jgi:hypothetical protein
MTKREEVHYLVDELTDEDLPTAERLLLGLRLTGSSVRRSLETAPIDDEPETEEERAAVAEALREREEGIPALPLEDVKRGLGIE